MGHVLCYTLVGKGAPAIKHLWNAACGVCFILLIVRLWCDRPPKRARGLAIFFEVYYNNTE